MDKRPDLPAMAVVATVCRRYHELASNLARLRELALAEWGEPPPVLAVWARPEPSRLWFFRSLLSSGLLSAVAGRSALDGEDGGATTAPESVSIRLGLERARAMWPGRAALVMAADVRVEDGTLSLVREAMASHSACAFHWENGCARDGVWHTNFFAVSAEEAWPPVSPPGHADVLERQWGRSLSLLPSVPVFRSHNSGERKFKHRHESEYLPPFASLPEQGWSCLPMSAAGSRTWAGWLRSLSPWGSRHGSEGKA